MANPKSFDLAVRSNKPDRAFLCYFASVPDRGVFQLDFDRKAFFEPEVSASSAKEQAGTNRRQRLVQFIGDCWPSGVCKYSPDEKGRHDRKFSGHTPAHPKRTISRTWRMQTLPAGINPLLGYGQRDNPKHSQRSTRHPLSAGRQYPGIDGRGFLGIRGRLYFGIEGRHHLGMDGRLPSESASRTPI